MHNNTINVQCRPIEFDAAGNMRQDNAMHDRSRHKTASNRKCATTL